MTTREDIFKALQTVMADVKLDFSKLTDITTDGNPVMIRKEKSNVFLLEKHIKDLEISHKKIYCIICYKECAQNLSTYKKYWMQ